jgi:hypothetical protein
MKTVVAGALGECVHVAGVINFLRLAEAAGWRTVFLGPAASIEVFLDAIRAATADWSAALGDVLVGASYRLTPETGERLLGEFAEAADDLRAGGVRFVFGGTPPAVERARAIGIFEHCFNSDASALHHPRSSLSVVKHTTTTRRSRGDISVQCTPSHRKSAWGKRRERDRHWNQVFS